MKRINPSRPTEVEIVITLLFLLSNCVYGQESSYPYFYRVFFRDKGDNPSTSYTAEDILSYRAIARRQNAGIPFPDFRDVPVDKDYLNIISLLGIKPDNTSTGVSIPVQTSSTIIGRSDGTSFSCPVLSGMAACLLQAVPGALNNHIVEVLHSGADRYNHPDSLYGYGTPDLVLALEKLQDLYFKVPDEGILAYPNPTSGTFEIIFSKPPESFTIEIISFTGKQLFRQKFAGYAGRTLLVTELLHYDEGVYFVRIINSASVKVQKIIKLKKGS